jgi:hypothetical protein
MTLSRGVPIPVAKNFSKQLLSLDIKARGKNKIQSELSRLTVIAPEYAEALQAAGLSVPSGVKVLPWAKTRMRETPL